MTRARWSSLGVLCSLLLVCPGCDDEGGKKGEAKVEQDGGKKAAADGGKAAADGGKAAGTCDAAHGRAVEEQMKQWCEIGKTALSQPLPEAPWAATPAELPSMGQVKLSPGKVMLDWRETSADELVGELASNRDVKQMRGEAFEGWTLVIEPATPRGEVVAVLRALSDAGLRQGRLALATKPAVAIPAPPDPKRLAELAAKVGGADASQKAMLLAQEIEASMPKCAAFEKTFSTMATVAADERCELLATGISAGLVECGCPKEAEMLTLMYGVVVGMPTPTLATTLMPVTLDPAATPRTGATWGELVAGLDEAALGGLWVGG